MGLRLLVLAAVLAAPALPQESGGAGSTWYVDGGALPPGDGSAGAPFYSVTYALSRAEVVSGDLVLVAPGDYLGEEVDFGGKDVTVESLAGAALTRLVAPPSLGPNDPHPVVRVEGGESAAVVRGFELTGGSGSFSCTSFTGIVGGAAAVCGSGARFEDCVFTSNSAERGGAVYGAAARLELVGCLFRGPGSDAQGEALYVTGSAVLVEDCTFEDLRIAPQALPAGQGAVLVDQSVALFRGCTFQRNATRLFGAHLWARNAAVTVEQSHFHVATGYAGASIAVLGGSLRLAACTVEGGVSVATPGAGLFASGAAVTLERTTFRGNLSDGQREGGAVALQASTLEAEGCLFEDNAADLGGALHVGPGSSALARRSRFVANRARRGGGAVAATDGPFEGDRCVFVGNDVAGSSPGNGPGGAVHGDTWLLRCTLTGNGAETGGAAGAGATLVGCIAWGNAPADLEPGVDAFRSLVGAPAGATTTLCVAADPRFFGPDDLSLLPGSPAIDALPDEFGADPDGSHVELGAVPYDPFYCGLVCDGPFGDPGCTSAPNSVGRVGLLRTLGSRAVADDRLLVTAWALPPGSFGMLVASREAGVIPLPAGAAPLCVAAPLWRFNDSVRAARPDGTLGMRLPLTTGPLAGQAAAGDTWHVQVWYRDFGPGGTASNTTSSVSFQLR